jgi:molybdenum cofactor cytidylyltransferase
VSPSEIAVSIMAEIVAEPAAAERNREGSGSMKFGPANPADAIGGVTVHAAGLAGAEERHHDRPGRGRGAQQSGRRKSSARLEEGDVSEDAAAASIARAVA